jgi:hypothetical protein
MDRNHQVRKPDKCTGSFWLETPRSCNYVMHWINALDLALDLSGQESLIFFPLISVVGRRKSY